MFISHQAPVNRNYFKTGDKIEHLSNALDDINMEFFGGNLKTITITLGNSHRNHRRTNGGAR